MSNIRPYVLTVAGFDPSGGAGVLADVKTFEQSGVYVMAVNTANTCQTEDSFLGVYWLPFHEIEAQLLPLLARYPFQAIKIGLIESLDTLHQVLLSLRSHCPGTPVVWDPILEASAGHVFHENFSEADLQQILEMVTVITPNWNEARVLGGYPDGLESAKNLSLYTHVFLKGGHVRENKGTDYLLTPDGETHLFVPASSDAAPKHGSGCVFSAALAAQLGKGLSLVDACKEAKQYTYRFLQSTPGLLGYHA